MKRVVPIQHHVKIDFSVFNQFIGKNCKELNDNLKLNVNLNGKSFARLIIEGLIEYCEIDMNPLDYQYKMIRVDDKNCAKNPSPLKNTNYIGIVNEDWCDSEFLKLLKPTYIFFLVSYGAPEKSIFKGFVKYNFSEEDLSAAENVWVDTRDKIRCGDYNHFLTDRDTGTFFFKAHAVNILNQVNTPTNSMEINRSFWISRKFLDHIIASTNNNSGELTNVS